VVDDEALKVSG
jgi:hypothetical protein